MSSPLGIRRDPALADWRDAVMRRDLRICEWLGMDPGAVFKLDDEDPNEYGEVEVTWESVAPEQPVRGKVTATGARVGGGEPMIHSGTVWLPPDDAAEMLEVAGPRPAFPITAEQRAQLEALVAGELLFEGDRVYVAGDGTVRWAGNAPGADGGVGL